MKIALGLAVIIVTYKVGEVLVKKGVKFIWRGGLFGPNPSKIVKMPKNWRVVK